jgi:hypothetical protein
MFDVITERGVENNRQDRKVDSKKADNKGDVKKKKKKIYNNIRFQETGVSHFP